MDEAMLRLADRCTFTVLWKPYLLDESLTEESMSLENFMRKLKGDEAAEKTLQRRGLLYEEAEKLNLFFDVQRYVNSSVRSHCLLELAGSFSLEIQGQLTELLFRGHLSEGELIDNAGFLLRCAEQVGLNVDDANQYMNDRGNQQRVHDEFHGAVAQIGVTRLPFVVISADQTPEQRVAFAGDQSSDTFVTIIDQLLSADTPLVTS